MLTITDEDLELIFSRFGTILSCEVIRDKRTGDSLQYAFIEYAEQASCEQAYFKMQGVLIDDHRIHVDFSQSVSKLSDSWRTATNTKRRAGGGFGGVSGLEKKRQYRGEISEGRRDRYGMVIDEEELRRRGERERDWRRKTRSPSPVRRGARERSRSPRRERRDDGRRRDDRERDGYGGRDRDRDRGYGDRSGRGDDRYRRR